MSIAQRVLLDLIARGVLMLHRRRVATARGEAKLHVSVVMYEPVRSSPPTEGNVSEPENRIAEGRYVEALPHLKMALVRREAARPFNGSLLSVTLNNLGYLSRVMGKSDAARLYLKRALKLRQEIFGPANAHRSTATKCSPSSSSTAASRG